MRDGGPNYPLMVTIMILEGFILASIINMMMGY